MKMSTIKTILVLSFILYHAFEWYLDFLDTRHMNAEVPENVRDVYDAEAYRNWIAYHRANQRLQLGKSLVSFVVNLLMLLLNFYAFVFGLFGGSSVYLQYFLALLLFITIDTVIAIPFRCYDTFVIEEKFGMNRTTKKTFILDTIKSWIISAVLGYGLTVLIMFLYERFGDPGIILICVAIILFSLLIALVAVPLMRIFNKFTPLEDGTLKEALLGLCTRYGVRVKKIVVDDNLVKDYEDDQIVAVFAHEFAHARFNHVLKSLPFSMLRTVLAVAVLGLIFHLMPVYKAFGFEGRNYYFAMTVLTLFTWPVSKALDYISNRISRKHEYEADGFAAKEGYGEALISALKKLSKDSLSNLNPHPLIVKLEYSHPTLSQRIDAIRKTARDLQPETGR